MCGGNPYTENHILRVSGTLICVTGVLLADFLLFFWQDTDVTAGSQWGLFFVRPVRSWRTWWYPAQQLVCEIAENRDVANNYDWGASFLATYTGVDLSELCGTFYRLMILALLTCFATLCFAVAVLIQVTLSRLYGDPEACSHPYYDHCKNAIALVVICVLLIIVTSVTFVIAFRASNFGPNVETKMREGLFVLLLSSASLGLVIFAYMRDRALLATKFEFEQLEWKPVGDGKEEYRKRMQYDMQRLEAAKYGGLQSPYQMARDADAVAGKIHGHDKYMVSHAVLWGGQG